LILGVEVGVWLRFELTVIEARVKIRVPSTNPNYYFNLNVRLSTFNPNSTMNLQLQLKRNPNR